MSDSLIRFHVQELRQHWPFSEMTTQHLQALVHGLRETYHARHESVLKAGETPERLALLRRGQVQGTYTAGDPHTHFVRETGDVFAVAAFWAKRALRANYVALSDCFVLWLDGKAVRDVAQQCPVWQVLNNAVHAQLQASLKQLQQTQSQWLQQQQAFESPLSQLPQRQPLTVPPDASVREGLVLMQQAKVGSVLVSQGEAANDVLGILTRDDVISRITLVGLDLDTPIKHIMSSPVKMLSVDHTLHDAAVMMGQERIRHVPLTAQGRLHSIVSERDLFTLQRYSSRQISAQIGQAQNLRDFQQGARDIRDFTRMLLGQGVQAPPLTGLISQLNDVLTRRLVEHHATRAGLDLSRACWVALGSEERAEQTVSTDQDNAWLLANDMGASEQKAFIEMALHVNNDLDACGYPLCRVASWRPTPNVRKP